MKLLLHKIEEINHRWIYDAETGGGLDDLMMGDVSEDVKESDEAFKARVAAAHARMAKVKKQEGRAKGHDHSLAKLIRSLSKDELDLVIFCVDHEVPSLTVLALLSVFNQEAGKICHEEFHRYIEEKADFSLAKFGNKKAEAEISLWWTFIVGADLTSDTVKLQHLQGNKKFVKHFSHFLSVLLRKFLHHYKIDEFDIKALEKIVTDYQKELFGVVEDLDEEYEKTHPKG